MENKLNKTNLSITQGYENNYIDLPFEAILREYRKMKLDVLLKEHRHGRFIEIGCGPEPLFLTIGKFEKMIVVEPAKVFFEMAQSNAKANPNILIINDFIENSVDKLKGEIIDFIVIGGFLHEIYDPDKVLQAVREICNKDTFVYSFVPNARSFHRLLAFKMGIVESIYQKSGHDELFKRNKVYDIDSFNRLLSDNGFNVVDSGSYFIKPFTHEQMEKIFTKGIINKACLDGLDKMIEYMPDMGAELWNICKKND
jgi:SAM-dependent methyltransferase